MDERSLAEIGGLRNLRLPLARALERVAVAGPRAVAIDVILADAGEEAADAALESAFAKTRNLVLDCELIAGGWEEPLARFARHAGGGGPCTRRTGTAWTQWAGRFLWKNTSGRCGIGRYPWKPSA